MDGKSKDNHRSRELQSWTKVLGDFCIYGAFFQFILKKTSPSPHKHTLDACIESFFPSFNIV